MTPHTHGADCPPTCSRALDLDPRTVTDLWRLRQIVREHHRDGKPSRKGDKPLWWWFSFHFFRAFAFGIGAMSIAWIARKLGLPVFAP